MWEDIGHLPQEQNPNRTWELSISVYYTHLPMLPLHRVLPLREQANK